MFYKQKQKPTQTSSTQNLWIELAKKKREETHQSFYEDCFGKKFDKFDFDYYFRKCIEELETWLFNQRKSKVKVDSGHHPQDNAQNDAKVSQVRMPELNIGQIDRILRDEDEPDRLSIKKNLQIVKLIHHSNYLGFRPEQGCDKDNVILSRFWSKKLLS